MISGLNVGRLDAKITFQQPVSTRDSIGQDNTTSWTVYKTTYAQRVRKPAAERYEGSQQVAPSVAEYKLRHDAGITATMRLFEVQQPTVYFYIRDVQHNRREGFTIITTERRDNG
jgi:SPP1 family predicted phage head-tail adaptor